MKTVVRIGLFDVLLAFCLCAQTAEPIEPGGPLPERPNARRPDLPEFLPETPDTGLTPPTLPEGQRPSPVPGGPSFILQGVAFEGNTVFSDQTLEAIAADFVGKQVSLAELEELRYRLTRFYTDRGYINSGAILKPGQIVKDGIVTYQVREGNLDQVLVEGTGRLRPDYVRNRIWPEPQRPFNTEALQERFQLLLRDPLIERLNGELLPGTEPGSAILDLEVTRARPYELSIGVDNHRPPSTGAERIYGAGVLRNLSGHGDVLYLSGDISDGADDIYSSYSIPFSAYDSRFFMRYDSGDSGIIEEPLDDLDIESETTNLELGLSHPVYRSLRRTITLGATLAKRKSQTFLLGEPFPFEPGASDDGKTRVTVLRLSQELLDRTADYALALRSTFSFGLDALDATEYNEARPDGQFLAWLGQAQYARRLGEGGAQLILRGDLQLADDALLNLERFAVGGVRTVRGYRENELVRDNGYAISAELRYPLWNQGGGILGDLLEITAFMDFGAAWNKGENIHDDRLHSVGLGLLWTPSRHLNAELYFAHDIEEAEPKEDHNLQDDGIHFSLSFNL